MSIVNLESTIRTCKTNTSNAERMLSDRFLNPGNMVCPVWNGLDTAGRLACQDSFYTKRAGCNSAQDRVGVENIQRPQYMQYISSKMDNNYNYNSAIKEGVKAQENYESPEVLGLTRRDPTRFSEITGNFGGGLEGSVWPTTCKNGGYDEYSKSVMGV